MSEEQNNKGMLYLTDAAKVLSEAVGIEYTPRNILVLAKENKIRLYWRIENRPVRKVEETPKLRPPYLLPYRFLDPKSRAYKKIKEGTVVAKLTSWGDKEKVLFVANQAKITPTTMPYYAYRALPVRPMEMNGYAALEFNERNLFMKESLLSMIEGTRKPILSCDGVILSRSNGLWQIIEEIKGKPCLPLDFPEVGELLVTMDEVETLARTLKNEPLERPPVEKEKANYLNVIGALLALLSAKTQSSLKKDGFIKDEVDKAVLPPPYSSEAAVIEAINCLFEKSSGLSKRNLEDKFRDAKRSFGLDEEI